jgi:pimeloyl-[acyl-carrier protein] methyl ester esterase
MPFFENRSGEQLWYEDAGTGTVIVLVHGWCMSSAVWCFQFKGLEKSYRVIAPDLRGHGQSGISHGPLNFEGFAADLADILTGLALYRVILVGWSMGALIAMQAYDEISDRLAGLVLVAATPCFTVKQDFQYGLQRNESNGMRVKVGRNTQRALEGFHARMFADGEFENLQLAGQIISCLGSIVPPETSATLAALDSLAAADMRDLLSDIKIPTLILNGDCDKICLPQASGYLVENITAARHKVFHGCGHAPFLSRATEFNAEIARFAESVL